MAYSNEPYVLHNNIKKKSEFEYFTDANGQLWLKVFHQNTNYCYFESKLEANYSLSKNCFSLIRYIDEKFLISKSSQKYYSFLLEYPQIPEYIEFVQEEHFNTSNPKPAGFNTIKKKGAFLEFGGLHQLISTYSNSALLVGRNNAVNWDYPIGTISKDYYPLMPIFNRQCLIVDLWIEIKDLNIINQFTFNAVDCSHLNINTCILNINKFAFICLFESIN
ncbi:hypothetical protein TVAG_284260 [Trichomonas vaginalis G3]|uniref:Uncharacterized protein n=1 Tax=Trichomonas vaginalis (strain ATCC PRA-98 / G3) TaxID=412133 RepID=A2G3E6_TRIV3|nr:hypothetical protein TVAGG3_0834950 [Trichomonas vaginalis G3]EAX88320.1 hypothetical protein TVAG_284260 [Trichomonas vaginalis G3]KAI5498843.1 hypothetical protein TVAGG3_0834950 [Trichomonas vaginalis G3]|eukprot:XP_001301250.1 hypothetical protein [Trichomonas vaginalis G3]